MHAAPGVERKQIIVAADDRRRTGGKSQLQVFVILRIATVSHPHCRRESDGTASKNLQEMLTALRRNSTREFGTVQNIGDLSVNRGRERKHIDFFGTQQGLFGNAVRLKGRTDNGRGVEDDPSRRSAL